MSAAFSRRFSQRQSARQAFRIAIFADTIIASFLAAGALSALYYADRLNQLPIGVIGIAVGTVLLPEMASRIAAGDERGARRAQARAIELALLLAIPFVVAFLLLPELIMRALFMRGAFTAADARAAGTTLAAYAIGLLPFVLIQKRDRNVSCPGRHCNTGESGPKRCGGQRSVQNRFDGALGAGRACARNVDRRLAQFRASRLVRCPCRPSVPIATCELPRCVWPWREVRLR